MLNFLKKLVGCREQDLQDKLESQVTQITNLEVKYTVLRENDAVLKTRLNSVSLELDRTTAELRTANNSLKGARDYSSDLVKAVEKVQTELNTANSTIETLLESLDSARNQIKSLESSNSNLDSQLSFAKDTIELLKKPVPVLPPETLNRDNLIEKVGVVLKSTRLNSLPYDFSKYWYTLEDTVWAASTKAPSLQVVTPQYILDLVHLFYPAIELTDMADSKYQLTSIKESKEIFYYAYTGHYPYSAEYKDCDDSAERLRLHFVDYGVNGVLSVFGMSGWGYHAFNLIPCTDGLLVCEPQLAGKIDSNRWIKQCPETIVAGSGPWVPQKVRVI